MANNVKKKQGSLFTLVVWYMLLCFFFFFFVCVCVCVCVYWNLLRETLLESGRFPYILLLYLLSYVFQI